MIFRTASQSAPEDVSPPRASRETPTLGKPPTSDIPPTATGVDIEGDGDNKNPSPMSEVKQKRTPAGSGWRGKMVRAGARRGRGRGRGWAGIVGSGDEKGDEGGGREQAIDAKKAAQHKIIEEMMAKQVRSVGSRWVREFE